MGWPCPSGMYCHWPCRGYKWRWWPSSTVKCRSWRRPHSEITIKVFIIGFSWGKTVARRCWYNVHWLLKQEYQVQIFRRVRSHWLPLTTFCERAITNIGPPIFYLQIICWKQHMHTGLWVFDRATRWASWRNIILQKKGAFVCLWEHFFSMQGGCRNCIVTVRWQRSFIFLKENDVII